MRAVPPVLAGTNVEAIAIVEQLPNLIEIGSPVRGSVDEAPDGLGDEAEGGVRTCHTIVLPIIAISAATRSISSKCSLPPWKPTIGDDHGQRVQELMLDAPPLGLPRQHRRRHRYALLPLPLPLPLPFAHVMCGGFKNGLGPDLSLLVPYLPLAQQPPARRVK